MAKAHIQEEETAPVLLGLETEKSTEISKCPGCGANLVFSPETQTLSCEHCGTEVSFDSHSSEELAFEKLLESSGEWQDETHVFSCNNCGAKQILNKDEIATECAFCGTTNIVETDELSGLKPNALVPFCVTREAAGESAKKWAKKRFFAPRKFKKSVRAEEIRGTYNPAFTFDAQSFSTYYGRLGRYKYVTRTVNGKTVTERRTEYFTISGNFSYFFDDILIQANESIKQKIIEKLQPFRTNDSKQYSSNYLHGYTANQYTKDGIACWGEARTLIDKRIRSGILGQYTYDFVDYLNIKSDLSDITYKYLLLPVYVGHFNFRQKLYNFFVNGLNGKVAGKVPTSPLKVLLVTLVGLAALAGIAYLVYLFGFS